MPNQNNFRSDITTREEPRFTASRIVRFPAESILYEEIPASFGYDYEDNIEIHFYTVPGNQLLESTRVKLSDNLVKLQIVSYKDNSYKNYLEIDFTELALQKDILLPPSDYRIVFNFFSDEIGSYDNRKLTITNISPSRSEVELVFNDTTDDVSLETNQTLFREFIDKAFIKADAAGVTEKIFKSGVEIFRTPLEQFTFPPGVTEVLPEEGLTSISVQTNIDLPNINQTYENTLARIDRLGLRQTFDEQLNDFILYLYTFIREEIIINGDERIQKAQFMGVASKIIKEKIGNLRQTVDSRIKVS